jgi:hypothetical protein
MNKTTRWLCELCRVYPKCLDKLQEWVSHAKTGGGGDITSIYVRRHLVFEAQPNHELTSGSSYFYLWCHFKYPQCIQLQLKIKRHFTNAFLLPVKPLQPPWDLWVCATACVQTCPRVHWFRWRTLLRTCGINSMDFKVTKLKTCSRVTPVVK